MKVKKVESTIRPSNFRIEDQKGNLVTVAFSDDIEQVTRTTEDDKKKTFYSYYEYKIQVIYREDLESYITENYETWYQLAKEKFIADKSAEIRSIRDKLLAESDKYVLIDRLDLNIPSNITATSMLSVVKDLFSSLGKAVNGNIAVYRQALRDITKQEGFPYDVEFPTMPEDEEAESE